jgi:ABC-type multidrug transport system fused ATPase/permease subunit
LGNFEKQKTMSSSKKKEKDAKKRVRVRKDAKEDTKDKDDETMGSASSNDSETLTQHTPSAVPHATIGTTSSTTTIITSASAPPRIVVHVSVGQSTTTDTKYLWRVKADEWPPQSLAAFVGVIQTRFCAGASTASLFIRDDELNDEFALADLEHLLDVASRAAANVVNVRCRLAAAAASTPTDAAPANTTTTTTTNAAVASTASASSGTNASAAAAAPAIPDGTVAVTAFSIDRRNELVVARDDADPENVSGEMKVVLNGVNFRRMRSKASPSAPKPVICFVGPTAVGKSALISTLTDPADSPVVALPGQVIPTTSNVNAFQCTLKPLPDDTYAHVARQHEQTAAVSRLKRTESVSSSGGAPRTAASDADDESESHTHSEAPSQSRTFESGTHSEFRAPQLSVAELTTPLPVCLLDVEGDDGGLPLLEYAKTHDMTGMFDGAAALNSTDIADFVQSLLENVSRDEINAYMDRRKFVTRVLLPKLIYVVADVIVFVNSVPAHRESAYLERVLEFCEKSQQGVSSAERPSLILVHNMSAAGPYSVEQSTRAFMTLVDRKSQLAKSYRTIDVIKVPNWRDAELYKMQLNRLHLLMAQRSREAHALKRRQGILVPERTWYDLLDVCLENFDSKVQLSMSRIFARLIVSDAALANSAFKLFDALYAPVLGGAAINAALVVPFFSAARLLAVRMLAHQFLLKLLERGVGTTVEAHGALDSQLEPLLMRIDACTPCAFRNSKGEACTGEQSTHGDVHRLPHNNKARGTYKRPPGIMDTDETRQELLTVLNDNESLLEAAVAGDAKAVERMHRRRAALLHQGVREWTLAQLPVAKSSYAHVGCVSCLDQVADIALSCGHGALCRRCSNVLLLSKKPARSQKEKATATIAKASSSSSSSASAAPAGAEHAPRLFACALCVASMADKQILTEALRPLNDSGVLAQMVGEFGGVANEVCLPAPLAGTQGLRVLVLESGGARLALQLALLERVETVTGMRIGSMFELIGGSGQGGLLAVLLAGKQLSLQRCRALVQRLDSEVLEKSKAFASVRSLMARAQFSAAKLNALLAEVIGDQSPLLQPQLSGEVGEEQHPKLFALVATPSAAQHAPLVLTNYPAGRRCVGGGGRGGGASSSPSPSSSPSAASSSAAAAAAAGGDEIAPDPQLEALLPLWHVARASLATPLWFKAAQVVGAAGTAIVCQDGSLVCASPALYALNECDILYGGAAQVDLLLACGVGVADAGSADGKGKGNWPRKAAGDQLLTLATRGAGPRDLATEAVETDVEVRRRQGLVPGLLRNYIRIDPELPVLAQQGDTRQQAARLAAESACVAWIKSAEAEKQFALLRATVIANSFFLDGAGVAAGEAKRAGDKQAFVVALRRRAQAPGVPVRFVVAVEPSNAFASVKVKESRSGCTVSYTLSEPKRATDVVCVSVYAVVAPVGVVVADDFDESRITTNELAGSDPSRIVHVSGSPFYLRRLAADDGANAVRPTYLCEIVDHARAHPLHSADDEKLVAPYATSDPAATRLSDRLGTLRLKFYQDEASFGGTFFAAAAVHLGGGNSNANDVRRIVARWLASNADFRTEDGRTLQQRLDATRDTWAALIERVKDGARHRGDWMCALALAEALGSPLLIVSGVDLVEFACVYWPKSRLRRDDAHAIAVGCWGANRWRALESPSPAVLHRLVSNSAAQ